MNINSLTLSLKIFFAWLFLLFLFVLIGGVIFGGLNGLSLYDLANWDGRHFLDIAQNGYEDKIQHAFFPLYPFLINLFSKFLTINFLYSAIIINLLSVFGSIYLFLNILKNYSENVVKTILLFLIFPTAFYLIAVYSESLFLFLTLLVFFFSRQKKYFLAALFTSFVALTRIAGFAVVLALAVDVFSSNLRPKHKLMALLISISGIILYCIFLYYKTGNPLYFFVSELSWGRTINIPGSNIRDSILYIVTRGVKPESFTIFSDLIFTIFGIGMGIRVIRFLKPSLAVYSGVSLLIPLSTAILLSVPRFLLVIFPIFIVVSKIKNRIFTTSYVIISLVLLFLYFNFFLRNIWVS